MSEEKFDYYALKIGSDQAYEKAKELRETYVDIFNLLSMVESALNGKRYWIDILGRPRRSPLERPLLHKGRKGKKHG